MEKGHSWKRGRFWRPDGLGRWLKFQREGQVLTLRQIRLKLKESSDETCVPLTLWSRAEAAGMAGGQMRSGARGEGTCHREWESRT